jgi:branched-chain amino acid transport system substrate-binding protein
VRHLVLALALLLAAASLSACGAGEGGEAGLTPGTRPDFGRGAQGWREVKTDVGVTDSEIKLGHTNALSGSVSFPQITTAMQAYFEKVNREDGGVCGRRIRLLAEDDQFSPPASLERARKLALQDQVVTFVGNVGTAPVTAQVDFVNDPNGDGRKDDGIPHLLVITGAAPFNDPDRYPWTSGFNPPYSIEGPSIARYLEDNAQRLAGKAAPELRVSILYQNDDLGRESLDAFRAIFRGTIATAQSYEATAPDISSQLANLRAANPDILVLFSTPRAAALAFRYIRSTGWNVRVVLDYPNGIGSLKSVLGPDADALRGASFSVYMLDPAVHSDLPPMREHARIMQQYGGPPPQTFSVYGQGVAEITVEMLKRACQRGDMTRRGILAAHDEVRGFHPSLAPEGVTVNLGPRQRRAFTSITMVEIQADGSALVRGTYSVSR